MVPNENPAYVYKGRSRIEQEISIGIWDKTFFCPSLGPITRLIRSGFVCSGGEVERLIGDVKGKMCGNRDYQSSPL